MTGGASGDTPFSAAEPSGGMSAAGSVADLSSGAESGRAHSVFRTRCARCSVCVSRRKVAASPAQNAQMGGESSTTVTRTRQTRAPYSHGSRVRSAAALREETNARRLPAASCRCACAYAVGTRCSSRRENAHIDSGSRRARRRRRPHRRPAARCVCRLPVMAGTCLPWVRTAA